MVKYDKIIKTCEPLIHPHKKVDPAATRADLPFRYCSLFSGSHGCLVIGVATKAILLSREQNSAKVWRFLASYFWSHTIPSGKLT